MDKISNIITTVNKALNKSFEFYPVYITINKIHTSYTNMYLVYITINKIHTSYTNMYPVYITINKIHTSYTNMYLVVLMDKISTVNKPLIKSFDFHPMNKIHITPMAEK